MPFLNRATVVCSLAGILTVGGLTSVQRIPVIRAAARASEAGDEDACYFCHKDAVDGFARSPMGLSMRLPAHEAEGVVHTPQATLRIYSNPDGTWQALESHGVTETYRIDYVIGSGTHASGYIVALGNHLFQSPIAWYERRAAYGLAPGYESETDPDFTRPIKPGCLFCHAGSFAAVPARSMSTQPSRFRILR